MELSGDVKPWCRPANPRLLCRKSDVHLPDGQTWHGPWVVGRLVTHGGHPPVYTPMESNSIDGGVLAGWEYAASLRDMSSVPIGRNPHEPQLSSRYRYRLWLRRTKPKFDSL